METFSTIFTFVPKFAVNIFVTPQPTLGQERFAAFVTLENLGRFVRAVDVLLKASFFCEIRGTHVAEEAMLLRLMTLPEMLA